MANLRDRTEAEWLAWLREAPEAERREMTLMIEAAERGGERWVEFASAFYAWKDETWEARRAGEMDEKFGDRHQWVWHVYENEGHGIGYQIELEEPLRRGGGWSRASTMGPELDRREDAELVVETFRKTWGGSYVFHSLEEWVAEQMKEEQS